MAYNNRPKTILETIRDSVEDIANHMGVVVEATTEGTTTTLDKTFQEIWNSYIVGINVIVVDSVNGYAATVYAMDADTFKVYAGESMFIADSADGYPSITVA